MRYIQNKTYSWNPLIAYGVGLIASDGCLSKDGRHITLPSIDIEQLENFSLSIGRSLPISKVSNSSRTQAYRVQFSDVAYYDFLLTIGIKPAKSKSIGELKVPDEFFADFLRGLFDGDGSIYGFWDKRWRSSLMYYFCISSASPKFLDWISSTNSRLIGGIGSGFIKSGTRVEVLSYAKADSQKIFPFIYDRNNSPKLMRKYNKFVAFLQSDPYADSNLLARVAEW